MTKEENIKFREDVIKAQFKHHLSYDLNLDNPTTFNEKIQWLKLYYHDPLITKCSDKYLAREYIADKIGDKYLIPLIEVYDNAEDIDFNVLPNQFVLKINWGSGQNIIVKDKSTLNIEETKNKLKYWMEPANNHYYGSFEWAYKNIKPKIICEKYIEQFDGNLYDYKIFCFNGEPKYVKVNIEHIPVYKECFYDINWNKLELETISSNSILYEGNVEKPICFDLMIEIAKKLSKDFVFIRVDFYIIENLLKIGELTFYPSNGMSKFKYKKWDYELGELLTLPKEKKIEYDYIDIKTLMDQVIILEPCIYQYRVLRENTVPIKEHIKKINSFIDKIAWWIPIKNLKNKFKNYFKYNITY
ncbi:ATP-grasp fold amidoligase family protein [Brachyspira intermedia]|uniref:ATP-grasp fold amidoligase family protein n=1 Tax=Brachyspira intermedia TaxID=84377 RepID=UPI0030063EB7